MKRFASLFLVLVLCLPILSAQSVSSLLKATASTPAPAAQADPLGRDTPSGTVVGFLQAEQNGNEKAAADYLQMSTTRRQSQGADLAIKLKVLMDRAFVGSLRRISTNAEGSPESGTPDQQMIGTFSVADTDVPVILVRVHDANGRVWLFSSDTLSKVPELYDNVEAHQVETKLPRALVQNSFAGMPIWQWLALLLAIPVAAVVGYAIVLFLAIPRRLYLAWRKKPNLHTYSRLSKPLILSFGAIAHRLLAAYLGLPLLPRFYYYRTIGVLVTVGFFWFLFRLTTLTMQRLRTHANAVGRTGTGTLMVLGERLLKALVLTVAVLSILALFGFNLTTVLAGLGIGGIAIAFAAQKTLENLFGGISVLADEVIRVGDYCRFGDRVGTVEDISLRSTRVRTDERTQLSIPNGAVATMNVENITRREKILFNPSIGIRPETSPDQLRYVLAEIRRLLYEHPMVESETARVRFASIDSNALSLHIFCYVLTRDFAEFVAIREDLLLRILEIIKSAGTALALPSQVVDMSRDSQMDAKKAAAAEAQVRQWRELGQLPFPDFSPNEKAAIRDSIVYPAPESAVARKKPEALD